MQNTSPSYRPHDPGHNYYDKGIYLITLVVSGRENLLSNLNMDIRQPSVILKDVGTAVMDCWRKIPEFQQLKGRKVHVHIATCMPDHFHGVLEVEEPMDVSVGEVIRGFKIGCTKAWQQLSSQPNVVATNSLPEQPQSNSHPEQPQSNSRPEQPQSNSHPDQPQSNCHPEQPQSNSHPEQPHLVDRYTLQHMSHRQRQAYYATLPRVSRPLFDANYDDTICLNERHKQAMLHYVDDNPRRAIMRLLRPDYTRRLLHIRLTSTDKHGQLITRDYAAFGNLFLLRWARKIQVFCHRRLPGTNTPYETTPAYQSEHDTWVRDIMQGATVIVTPGISKGELLMKHECLEHSYPLIHIQKEPIGRYWKPEQSRFDACVRGALLILAPWAPELLGEVNHAPSNTDYSIFHNLNDIAAEICRFEGDAYIVRNKYNE